LFTLDLMSRDAKEAKYLSAFGKRIAEVRRAKGFTQESLAEKANVTALTVSYIEQGRQWPRISTAKPSEMPRRISG
jgi:DNA-binding XRE family transcriptional regulator